MSEEKINKGDDQVIDLTLVLNKLNNFFESILAGIFNIILYIKSKILKLVLIFFIGAAIGYYFDFTSNVYKNEIIVSPNLGGYDFIYSKVELISSKLAEQDKVFFKSIGVTDFSNFSSIKVDPIIDIYALVNNSTSAASAQHTENFELIKLLAEESTFKKAMEDKITSRNYPLHTVTILTNGQVDAKVIIDPIMNYLNSDKYFNTVLQISRDNVEIKIKENQKLIKKVDSVISILTVNLQKNKVGNSLVYNSENNQLNPMFDLKNNLINELGTQKIQLVKMNFFIKEISRITNLKNDKGLEGKMKLIVPILFLGLFILLRLFGKFYSRQMNKKLNK